MARITGSANERVFQIKAWGGLNENPDGDTKLKMGEAAVMRNFRITRDGNLQRRPGSKEIAALLNVPEETVRTRLSRARAKLKNILSEVSQYDPTRAF